MASKAQINLIRNLARNYHLDPRAVLAVAAQEGLSGGIGDQGTSFGPFQLHRGGALPGNIPLNKAHSWAWSNAGLNYALGNIASVAAGKSGKAAVNAIVRLFERPANPDREVAGALRTYGVSPQAISAPVGREAGLLNQQPSMDNGLLLKAILSGQSDLTNVIRAIYAQNPPGGSLSPSQPLRTPLPGPSPLSGFKPAELLREGVGGPTNSTGPHIHVAYTNPQALLSAIRLAQSLGLRVAENPYVGSVAPVHAKNSYHYRVFPGLYHGRKLGEAIDVTGKKSAKFFSLLGGS